ncbi:UPF0182 family membrane protein [Catalinimonas niigatensis]|uniref:UPF0182 family membrane protein n=1 Tax=Catalinimonas niigatensis TaxID=1397264 RepID=UPI002666C7AD|nr:UPF0182 family protein [Catalinimonas niigatensis]WPP49978.1 UPF0182 family protein [Catalinimonas niigatensis]
MYTAIFIILAGLSFFFLYRGFQKEQKSKVWIGVLLGIFTISFSGIMNFWGELLWFQAVGFGERFWIATLAQWGMALLSLLIGGGLVWLLTWLVTFQNRYIKWLGIAIGAFIGGVWGYASWGIFLQFWYAVDTGVVDPILGKDTGFYLFRLPFLSTTYSLVVALIVIALLVSILSIFVNRSGQTTFEFVTPDHPSDIDNKLITSVFINSGILLILLSAGKYLDRFQLMYSSVGAVHGPGWTDDHIRLPAYTLMIILTFIAGLILLIPASRERFRHWVMRKQFVPLKAYPVVGLLMFPLVFIFWFISLSAIPGLFQWLRVEPNEITFEKPYITNNIEFTRRGFKLHDVEEREFPASNRFTREMVSNNQGIFDNVRLWDWRALDEVYRQFQEIRLYYEFVDVDVDRYMINGQYRQVMVSAREMEPDNLPEQSQTFVNQRFKYTHGYGITLTNVNEFTSQGLPNLLIKNIPPESTYESLAIERPEIYYGELTNSHVIVNSEESEFGYPQGDQNVYVRYEGTGGVQISNFWRKFVFGHMFDGTRLLLSNYPTSESRIMFNRNITDRVKTLAPFLEFEDDPYIVLVDGQLKWIIDAYTTSDNYPYSEPFSGQENIEYQEGEIRKRLISPLNRQFGGANYIRNSVKAVVDAYNGEVDFYVFDEEDPIIQVWQRIFPEVFQSRQAMPEALQEHIRYPEKMLLAQGLVYAKYHMTDPEVFYNQEDLWIRATEKYYDQVQPVEPYYIMWQLPESDKLDFVLVQPFTPKNRQVLIGWIAGLCDPENYGRFIAYQFPKEKRVLGPQQVETKIDQNSFLSSQLSLWNQRGSNVIRGNVLAIPIEETILYVEPIYLQSETAAYPELRLVVVMHNDELSYAQTFDDALEGIFGDAVANTELESTVSAMLPESQAEQQALEAEETEETSANQTLIQQANEAFKQYLESTGEKDFEEAAQQLTRLQELLQQLTEEEGNARP